jgi:dTDP-4-amino-4,6-dideoxygalactose transaminase
MHPLLAIAEKYGLVVIEDACQSHGASYQGQRVGSFGTGVFSFYPTKNMTSAEGGMITTNDQALAEKCCVIRQHGMRRRYYHDELGFNFRMTDVHAAIGLAQLNKLERFNHIRRENACYLNNCLQEVALPIEPEGCRHVYHQYTVRAPGGLRDGLRAHLQQQGIGSEVYYPVPIHQQQFYVKQLGYSVSLPESERAAAEVLSIPVHPSLSASDLEQVVSAVNGFWHSPLARTSV